jgi:hypothetical protein
MRVLINEFASNVQNRNGVRYWSKWPASMALSSLRMTPDGFLRRSCPPTLASTGPDITFYIAGLAT